jgi:hypothetical protein
MTCFPGLLILSEGDKCHSVIKKGKSVNVIKRRKRKVSEYFKQREKYNVFKSANRPKYRNIPEILSLIIAVSAFIGP